MITFKEYLVEVADKKIDYTVSRNSARFFSTKAIINDREVRFLAMQEDSATDSWDVEFLEVEKNPSALVYVTSRKTGSGKEFEVASFVIASMKEFIDLKQPAKITFSASKTGTKDSRPNVYKKLVTRTFPNFALAIRDLDDMASFTMTRKD